MKIRSPELDRYEAAYTAELPNLKLLVTEDAVEAYGLEGRADYLPTAPAQEPHEEKPPIDTWLIAPHELPRDIVARHQASSFTPFRNTYMYDVSESGIVIALGMQGTVKTAVHAHWEHMDDAISIYGDSDTENVEWQTHPGAHLLIESTFQKTVLAGLAQAIQQPASNWKYHMIKTEKSCRQRIAELRRSTFNAQQIVDVHDAMLYGFNLSNAAVVDLFDYYQKADPPTFDLETEPADAA